MRLARPHSQSGRYWRRIPCLCQESNLSSLVIQPVAQSLYLLSYPDSYADLRNKCKKDSVIGCTHCFLTEWLRKFTSCSNLALITITWCVVIWTTDPCLHWTPTDLTNRGTREKPICLYKLAYTPSCPVPLKCKINTATLSRCIIYETFHLDLFPFYIFSHLIFLVLVSCFLPLSLIFVFQ
jgi:hypothetical protein